MLTPPPPVRTDESNAFGNDTMRRRAPGIVDEILKLNPDYHPAIQDALRKLRLELMNDAPIRLPEYPAPDHDDWLSASEPYRKDTWLNTGWFYAEHIFYRRVIEAVRWWETQRDPFGPKKALEMNSESPWNLLEQALNADLERRLHLALWGNRIDLSYEIAVGRGAHADAEDLLVDDTEKILSHLRGTSGEVHLVADNYGTEFTMDAALIDELLKRHKVVLHVKLHPVFVSDVVVADVWDFLRRVAQKPAFTAFGQRLQTAFDDGRLRLAPDGFWNSPRFVWEMPLRLRKTFEKAALVIFKGDANHRRMIGDAIWPEGVAFADALDYFPAPVATLRTLKSDPTVGFPVGSYARLDSIDKNWRINGQRGVIQSKL